MSRGNWDEHVTIETMKPGHSRTITSADEAARVLMGACPIEDGIALRKACQACIDVLEGKQEPDGARKLPQNGQRGRVFVRSQNE